MKFAIDGYKFHVEFDDEAEARAVFNYIKTRFTYCELKQISNQCGYYYAESLEIYYK